MNPLSRWSILQGGQPQIHEDQVHLAHSQCIQLPVQLVKGGMHRREAVGQTLVAHPASCQIQGLKIPVDADKTGLRASLEEGGGMPCQTQRAIHSHGPRVLQGGPGQRKATLQQDGTVDHASVHGLLIGWIAIFHERLHQQSTAGRTSSAMSA